MTIPNETKQLMFNQKECSLKKNPIRAIKQKTINSDFLYFKIPELNFSSNLFNFRKKLAPILMKPVEIQILQTAILLIAMVLVRFFTKRAIKKIAISLHIAIQRRKVIVRAVNFLVLLVTFLFITLIWGVDRNQLVVFLTSTVTVLGIAFFAQWSILSNITAGLVVFFTHPLKLGDNIKIMEKDFQIEGRLDSISFFFFHIETADGIIVTIPNNVALQKSIAIIGSGTPTVDPKTPHLHQKPSEFPKL